jgi:mono/diheme cytochrome c family protein
MSRKTKISISVVAVIVLGAAAVLASAISARDPFAFAGPHRVNLAKYGEVDPTGVPGDLRNASLVQRGEYLTRAADCEACHTAAGGEPYAGGLAFATPFGALYSTNITPDKETGIGDYSDADFLNAVHEGIRRDGARLYPAMPYASYTYLTDDDALAIKAFLFSLKPVHAPPRENHLSFPFNQRILMAGWSLLFNAGQRFQPNPDRSAQWNRGAYLAEAMAHCGECHTPRNRFEALNNRSKFAGSPVDDWHAYNITADRDSGLGAWSDQDIAHYLSGGHADGHGTAAGPMGEAVTLSLSHLSTDDMAALVAYLRTVPPVETPSLPAPKSSPPSGNAQEVTLADNLPGRAIFSRSCAGCHGSNGVSQLTSLATLIGSRAVNDPSGANALQVIFYGERDYKNMMPAFGRALSDDDIANVVNYITSRFGTKPSTLTPAEVAKVRADWNHSQSLAQLPAPEAIPVNVAPHPEMEQPIPFSHRGHVVLGLQCSNCHASSANRGEMTLPAAATCMGCHAAVATDRPPIKKLAALAASDQPIQWARIYPLLAGVRFSHEPHLRSGVQCATCHGPVGDQTALSEMTSLTSMATCISCHQTRHVNTACATCHAWPQPANIAISNRRVELPFPGNGAATASP